LPEPLGPAMSMLKGCLRYKASQLARSKCSSMTLKVEEEGAETVEVAIVVSGMSLFDRRTDKTRVFILFSRHVYCKLF
jgi:hypothetical protein